MSGRTGIGIKEVARLADVSVGTVSNVLNRPELVSPARRRAVQRAIADLGYVPNRAARQLKVGESTIIGFVGLDIANPFYAELLAGAQREAERRGMITLLAASRGDATCESKQVQMFEQQRVRGVVVTPASCDRTAMRAARSRGTPIILVDSGSDGSFCTVGTDDLAGGRLAAQHLVDIGRLHIAVIGQATGLPQVANRHEGARAAAHEAAGVDVEFLPTRGMDIIDGRRMGQRIAAMRLSRRPDAVFATNDLLAIGLSETLLMSGRIRIPQDIAVIGYDDIGFCASAIVPLSSIHQPAPELGAAAVRLLEKERAQGAAHVHENLLLAPRLTIRGSTQES